MKRVWLKWPVAILLLGAVWLGARYAYYWEAERELREKYATLVRLSAVQRAATKYNRCQRDVQKMYREVTLERRRTGRLDKNLQEVANTHKKLCDALPYPSDKEVDLFNKNWESSHHELEKSLIALGRLQERSQVATEHILWDIWELSRKMDEELEAIKEYVYAAPAR